MKADYEKSVELALALDYKRVPDLNAFNGCYFIKCGKKWIHDINALKRKLGVSSNEELEHLDYDVKNFHKYKNHTNQMVDDEMLQLYNSITHLDGAATYLMDGMWLLPDGSMEER